MEKAETVMFPSWIFAPEHRGEYFLVTIDDFGLASVDGGHSSPRGVATADELIKQLGLSSAKNERRMMIHVRDVPTMPGKINKDAVAACRKMMNRTA